MLDKLLDSKNRKYLAIIFVLGILIFTLPIVMATGYTYLCEDDFSFEGGARDLQLEYGSSIIGAAHRTVEYYKSNQGTYYFNFIIHVLRPYYRGGLPLFHAFMIFEALFFIISLMFLIYVLLQDKIAALGVSMAAFMLIFGMNGTQAGRELFFWYTGGLNYTLTLSNSFLAAALCILYIRSNKKRFLCLSSLFAFLASGGTLNIVAVNCAWLLAVVIFSVSEVKKRPSIIVPFAAAFVGALINVVAPGNYIRSEEVFSEGHTTFVDGLRDTFTVCISRDKMFFTSISFILALLMAFLLCILLGAKIKSAGVSPWHLLIAFIGTAAVRFSSLFPIAYGYHVNYMANGRMESSYDIVAKLMYVLFIMFLAQWVREKFEKKAVRISLIAVCVALLCAIVAYPALKAELKDGMTYTVIDDFRSGRMLENYHAREYILSFFENAEEGSDAIVYVPPFRNAYSLYGMGLTIDCEEFVNRSAAGLFRLHTTTVIYME